MVIVWVDSMMVKSNLNDRVMLEMFCNVDRPIYSPDWWEQEYFRTIKCDRCLGPKLGYADPIPQYVTKRLKWSIELIFNTCPDVMKTELQAVLSAYLPQALWGPVYSERRPGERKKLTDYVSWWVPYEHCIVTNRNLLARHEMCSCGCVLKCNVNAKPALLRRYLDDRLLYSGTMHELIIDEVLVRQLDLRARFPDLTFDRLPIIEKPLDGQILPGDPGWNGTLVPKPITVLDTDDPESDKWQY